jgi:hypothetical protein
MSKRARSECRQCSSAAFLCIRQLSIGDTFGLLQNVDMLDNGLVLFGLQLLDFPFAALQV